MELKVFIDDYIMSRCPSDVGLENMIAEEDCVCDYEVCKKCWSECLGIVGLSECKSMPILDTKEDKEREMVEHPSHYNKGNIEVIEFIEDWKLDFATANIIKYVVRSPYKNNAVEDLKKAKFYLERLIKRHENI